MFYRSAEDKSVLFEDTVQSPVDNRDTELAQAVMAETLDRHQYKQVGKVDIQRSGLYQEVGKHWRQQELGSLASA